MSQPHYSYSPFNRKGLNRYKIQGRVVLEEEYEPRLSTRSWPKETKLVVHIILTDGKKRIAFVINAEDRDTGKRRGVGIPTGKIKNGENPIEAAKFCLIRELSIEESDFKIREKPVLVVENGRNVFHIIFWGTAKFPVERRRIITDPKKEVWKALFLDPFNPSSNFLVKTERKNGRRGRTTTVYKDIDGEREVYGNHLSFLNYFLSK